MAETGYWLRVFCEWTQIFPVSEYSKPVVFYFPFTLIQIFSKHRPNNRLVFKVSECPTPELFTLLLKHTFLNFKLVNVLHQSSLNFFDWVIILHLGLTTYQFP